MTYFLLTWDFRGKEDETEAAELAERCATRGKVRHDWSVGNTRAIRPKDIAFMLRQQSEPRGIIGAGVIRSEPYFERHWRDKRKKVLYVDIDWTNFAVEPLNGSSELQRRFKQVYWHPRRSGIRLPDEIGKTIEQDLKVRLTQNRKLRPTKAERRS